MFEDGLKNLERNKYNLNMLLQKGSLLGDLQEVADLIKDGADVHSWDGLPLRYASEKGHLEVVKYLVERVNADVHRDEDSALRYACLCGQLEVVKYLISKGAAVHALNDWCLAAAEDNEHPPVANYIKSIILKEKRLECLKKV